MTLLQQFNQMIFSPKVGPLEDLHTVPRVMYHYTTAAGFTGIIRQGCIRATNFSYLNDPSEIEYGRALIKRTLTERMEQSTGDLLYHSFLKLVDSGFELEWPAEVYVACFSELKDDLSQWRAYGSSSAERFAIGFDFEEILSLMSGDSSLHFNCVEYEEADQKNRIDDLFDRSCAFLHKHCLAPGMKPLEPLANLLAKHLAGIMPLFKNSSYQAEKEWRIIYWSPGSRHPLNFDTARGVIRPYIEIPLGTSPTNIHSVLEVDVFAPTRKANACKAAEMVLKQNEIDIVPKFSKIPSAE